jgi:hypothetical protein
MANTQKPYNCEYQAKFDEILQNVEYLKEQHQNDELQPGSVAFALVTELQNTLETLVDYKSRGCEKDIEKSRKAKEDFRNSNKSELFSFETKRHKLAISHSDFNKAVRSRGHSTARANALWKSFVELNNITPHKRKYLKDLRKLAKKSHKHHKKSVKKSRKAHKRSVKRSRKDSKRSHKHHKRSRKDSKRSHKHHKRSSKHHKRSRKDSKRSSKHHKRSRK